MLTHVSMRKLRHMLLRVVTVLTVAICFLLLAHTALCHSENVMCGHDGCTESIVCVCVCHTAIENQAEPVLVSPPEAPAPITVSDESARALLLPDDIFRPPLARA